MQITVKIPDALVQTIKLPEEEITARLHVELAIRLYRKKLLNFGKARALANMKYWDFYELLGKEGVERNYTVNDLNDDLQTLEKMF
jgi:predicted HTH domain antitoxin